MLSLVCALTLSAAWAANPDIVVVGAHIPGLDGTTGMEAANRITKAIDASGHADGLTPGEVSALIAGRESLILDTYALGPGRERLKEGTVLYERAQPDQAIPVLADAAKLLEAGLSVSKDTRDLNDALLTLGLAQIGLGEEAPAKQTFRRAIVLDPSRQLDTVRYSPDVVEVYEAVRKDVAAQSPAGIAISATKGARVWIDGKDEGEAPVKPVLVAPGEHYVLVRDASGASWFQSPTVAAGETKELTASLDSRSIGYVATDVPGRSRQTRELYKGVGAYLGSSVILLTGVLPDGQVGVQLYSPASGNFSRTLTGEAGGDPIGAIVDLVPTVVGYLGENGDVRSDRVSPQVLPLDLGANDVLAGMLFNPPKPEAVAGDDKKGVPWFVWAGVGAVVAGGGAAATVVVLSQTGTDPGTNDNGTIEFGPIP